MFKWFWTIFSLGAPDLCATVTPRNYWFIRQVRDIRNCSRSTMASTHGSIPFKYSTGDHLIMSSHIMGLISLDCKCFRIGVMWCTKSWDLLRSSFMQTGQVLRFHTWNSIIILTRLRNGQIRRKPTMAMKMLETWNAKMC